MSKKYEYGWTGKIARVNLTTGEISNVDTFNYVPKYIGGAGVAHRIFWEEVAPGTKAFDPENKIIMMVGPLTGTAAPTASRCNMHGIGPAPVPEQYVTSNCGGWFPAKLKWAGYDGIIIEGKAEKPSYILIDDEGVKIMDGSRLWGLGVWDTQLELKTIYGDYLDAYCIGRAGEKLVRFACVETYTARGFGQGGFGAVWGSKNLKAVCLTAQGGQIKVAHPDRLLDLRVETSPIKLPSPLLDMDISDYPWKKAFLDQLASEFISNLKSQPYAFRRKSCSNSCANSCFFFEFKDVPTHSRQGTLTGEIGCVGIHVHHYGKKLPKPESWRGTFEVNMLCDQYGLNENEVHGGIVPWLVKCKNQGLDLSDRIGFPIDQYNPDFWIKLITMMSERQGFGDLLAEGLARTVQELGPEYNQLYDGLDPITEEPVASIMPTSTVAPWGFQSHFFFYEQAYPIYLIEGLQWLIDSRDPNHGKWLDFGGDEMMDFMFDFEPYKSPLGSKMAYETAIRGAIIDSLLVCWEYPQRTGMGWFFPERRGVDTKSTDCESRFYSAVTGIETTEDELYQAGKRIMAIDRAVRIKICARTAEMEWNEVWPKIELMNTDKEGFASMVGDLYERFGWDRKTGVPTRETLESLDMKDVADELELLGKYA